MFAPKYLLGNESIAKASINDPHIFERIKLLCDGLDAQSKNTIFLIIHRLKKCYLESDLQDNIVDLTQYEIDEILRFQREFLPNITHIAPNVYHYGGYFLPKEQFEISIFWHKHSLKQAFSQATLESMRHKDFIDVGGFIGDSAIIFEREFCDRQIHSFEATRLNYNLMLETLKLNNSSRIIPINKALGSKQETLRISINGSGSSILLGQSNEFEEIESITLDSYVKAHNIEVGFIKVDIEGFEQEFLQGAKETICTQKPAMLISIYHQADDFFDIKPMIASWNLGYSFKII